MAKIKYSALVSEVRNKLNGSVLSKNRAGNYIRNKVTPVNPQTQYQQAARQALGSMSASWRGLTNAQRQTWLAATKSFPYTDIFGDRKELDGKSLFVKLNINLQNAGVAVIDEAPLPVGIPELAITDASFGFSDDVYTGSVTIAPVAVPAGFAILAYATPVIPPGVSFIKNEFRFIGVAPTPSGSGLIDLTSLLDARFDTVLPTEVGKDVAVRLLLVSTTTGQTGVPVEARATLQNF